jgi:CheY-like chemotaxis protein
VTLDIYLPDIEGWRVLERLKNDLHTRHVPVCVISTDEARQRDPHHWLELMTANGVTVWNTAPALLEARAQADADPPLLLTRGPATPLGLSGQLADLAYRGRVRAEPLDRAGLRPRLEPQEGRCCVTFGPRP